MDLKLLARLSDKLNKPVTENLANSLRAHAQNHSSEEFVQYCSVLGLVDQEFVTTVYTELQLQPQPQPQPVKPKTDVPKAKKKKLLSFDDDLGLDPVPSAPKAKPVFKKIKREDALRFKEPIKTEPTIDPTTDSIKPEPDHVTKPDLVIKQEPVSIKTEPDPIIKSEPDFIKPEQIEPVSLELESLQNGVDLETDREWYMADEYQDPIVEEETPRKFLPRPKPKPKAKHETGGGFNQYGEYFDLDHEQSSDDNDVSNIPINSHFFIPPFLDEFKEYLSVTMNDGNSNFLKGVTRTVDPVKNPNSHLAIMAKQGSLVVQERRSNREKMKQAKERSNIAGTKLGNILGVEHAEEKEPKQQPNPEEENSYSVTAIDLQRKSLPVYSVRSELLQVINDNQITIIIGETGSGKTTQLTQYLYEDGYCKNLARDNTRKMIACTQPRRVAAMSVAKRVSEEMNCKLGDEVGYVIRFEDRTSHDKTMIKYLTDGILLRELIADPTLDNYSCIIMDEAHERSLSTDILLGLLKNLIMKRKDLKLIITSATMNANKFTSFFGNAPQFRIPGRTFPVEVFYNRSSTDYVDSTVKQVITIHLDNLNEKGESDGDILVFMTGQEDIEVTCEMIQEKLDQLEGIPPLDVYPIYSTLPADLQKKIFNKSNPKRRKVVVATNIAETSLTVDGIKYVVDSGLVKLKVYNPKLGMDALQVIPISQANASQRSGRAGRTGPGTTFRLYSEKELNEDLNLMPIPEIQRTNLSNTMLLLRSLNVKDVKKFPFLDSPPKDIISYSLYDLWSIGALNNLGDLTDLGANMVDFPMEPSLAKLIIMSTQKPFRCSQEILIIVSMLSVPNIFFRPKERAEEADMIREKFSVAESDHLTLLNVYTQWELQYNRMKHLGKLTNWCNKNFLNPRSLLRAKDIKNQLTLIMIKGKYPILKSPSEEHIKRCLCATFFNQLAKLLKLNLTNSNQLEYINLRHNFIKMYLHPNSTLNHSRTLPPNYVIYHELILTKKEYMSCVTSVDPLWLLEYGYIFYGVSKHDKKKYLKELDFELIDQADFAAILDRDRVEYNKVDTVSEKKVVLGPKFKSKFKKRRGI